MAYSKLDEDPEPQPPPAAAKPPRPPSDVAGAARAKAPKKLASGKLPLPQAKSQRPLPKEVPKRKESGKTMLMIYLPEVLPGHLKVAHCPLPPLCTMQASCLQNIMCVRMYHVLL